MTPGRSIATLLPLAAALGLAGCGGGARDAAPAAARTLPPSATLPASIRAEPGAAGDEANGAGRAPAAGSEVGAGAAGEERAGVASPAATTTPARVTATSPDGATTSPDADAGTPPFAFSSRRISADLRARMTGVSWHRGCPVPLSRLRHLRVAHWDFRGRRRVGQLVVHRDAVAAMRTAFAELYAKHFPVRRMRLVDAYGGSDFDSIEADNTSAFNCRERTGGGGWSQHAYGRAIDVNPIENPYVYANGTTVHRRSRPYLDRSRVRRGMATRSGTLVRAFRRAGWSWGGRWQGDRDYQHFSATGG